MSRTRPISTILLLVVGLMSAPGAGAWTRETHVEIARQAATIAPTDLFQQIKRNEDAFVAGISSSLKQHRSAERDAQKVLGQIKSGAEATVAAIESHRPFREVVRNLGRLAIYAADANNPLLHSASDPEEGRYGGDYETYVASAVPRFPVIFYGQGRDVRTRLALVALTAETGRRNIDLYPMIGREYRRIGKIDGVGLFDDKSTAFGVGSIAFSHAVSDLAAIYRYIWLEAGGADRRELPVTLPGGPTQPPEQRSK